MIQDVEIQQVPHGGFYLLDPGIAKFNHFATIQADEVVVLLEAVGFLILGKVLAKLVLGDEVTTDQEFKSIVNGSPADPVV